MRTWFGRRAEEMTGLEGAEITFIIFEPYQPVTLVGDLQSCTRRKRTAPFCGVYEFQSVMFAPETPAPAPPRPVPTTGSYYVRWASRSLDSSRPQPRPDNEQMGEIDSETKQRATDKRWSGCN